MRFGRITSSGIPTWTYCDSDAFAWEREHLFRRSWGFACRVGNAWRRGWTT